MRRCLYLSVGVALALFWGSAYAGSEELIGSILGGVAGGVIGHQSGHRGEGAAWGIVVGSLLGRDAARMRQGSAAGADGREAGRRWWSDPEVRGAVLGGTAGGILGHQINEGDHKYRDIGIAAGSILGAWAGHRHAARRRQAEVAAAGAPAAPAVATAPAVAAPRHGRISYLPQSASGQRIGWRLPERAGAE